MPAFKLIWKYTCKGPVISVSATPNCSLIVAASVDRKIRLLNYSGKKIWERELENEVWSVSISTDGNYIAAGTANKNPADGSVYIFNTDGKQIFSYHIGFPVWSISLSKNAESLVVSSWGNIAYFFKRINRKYKLEKKMRLGDKGLYGISVSQNSSRCLLASYDQCLFLFDKNRKIEKQFKGKANTGLYNLKISDDNKSAVVGCRGGCFLFIPNLDKQKSILSPQLSQRPICGISISSDKKVIACGGFDGRIYLSSPKGQNFWTFQTNGEVWSTAISSDGSLICAGSGDQNIYFIQNNCNSSVINEIEAFENNLMESNSKQIKNSINRIAELYLRYGLIEYGFNRLKQISLSGFSEISVNKILINILSKYLKLNPNDFELHFLFANLLQKNGKLIPAIEHFQLASHDSNLQSKSLIAVGYIYSQMGYLSSAKSCYRRATSQYLDYDGRNVLYNLARSYEDNEDWTNAITLFEILISWDINYRNSLERIKNIKEKPQRKNEIDYTGVTVNLLGTDAPHINDIDNKLESIIQGRCKELCMDLQEHSKINEILKSWPEEIIPTMSEKFKQFRYSEVDYIKYDYLPPEDEIKKHIELIYELTILQENPWIRTSLDIGAATGRHPIILAKHGIKSIGLDVNSQAMVYAKKRKEKSISALDYPFFMLGDAFKLPFLKNQFDLITCMMGTFAHFPPDKRKTILLEIKDCIKPNGLFLISTWDIECNHLSFLSIYNQSDKQKMKGNSIKLYDLKVLLESNGFRIKKIIPFIFLPNVFSYELNLHTLDVYDIKKVIEIELAARSLYPYNHGEMFMFVCTK